MQRLKSRERSDIPLDKIAPIFCKRGYSIGIVNHNDRETMIAMDSQCIIYMYFPAEVNQEQKVEPEQTLYDKERAKVVRNINTLITKNIYDYIKNINGDLVELGR